MGRTVAELQYTIDGDPSPLYRALDEATARAKAKVAALPDGKIDIKADLDQLDRDIKEANAKIKETTAKKRTIKVGMDTSEIDRKLTRLRGQKERLEAKKIRLAVELDGAAKAVAEMKALQGAVNKVAAENDSMSASMDRSTTAFNKQQAEVSKLRSHLNNLYTDMKKLESVKPASLRTEGENLRLVQLGHEALVTKDRIHALGGEFGDITKDIEERPFTRFKNALQGISSTRVRLGPLNTTLKGLAAGASVLSPLLIGLVGGASALIGTIGAGLVGAFGVAAGAAAGFGIALLPLLPSLKSLVTEAKGMPAIGGALKTMKDSLSGGLRQPFFQAAHQSIKTLQADFPMFKQQATGAFTAVSKGWQSWMKGLRSPEAQGILSNLIGNFTKQVGPLMSGLGSLTTAFGRFISIASNSGPGIGKTFANWAQGIEQSTQAGSGFEAKVNSLVSQAKTLGSALTATGRLAVAFFGAGAHSGQDLLQSLTRSENRMTSWMHSVAGQKSLQTFFKDAVTSTQQFFSAVGPLLATFVQLGNALAPVTAGALKFATFVAQIVHSVASLAPARVSLEAFGATLGGIFLLNKASGAIGGITAIAARLGLVTASETGATAAVSANTAALEANTVAMAENAGVGATRLAGGLGAVGEESVAAAAGLGAMVLPLAVAAVGVGALYLLTKKGKSASQQAAESLQAYQTTVAALPPSLNAVTKASRDGLEADKAARKAKNDLFGVTQKFIKGDASYSAVAEAQRRANTTSRQVVATDKQRATAAQALVTSTDRVAAAQKAVADAQRSVDHPAAITKDGRANFGPLPQDIEALAKANSDLAQAQQHQTFDQINQARAMNGLRPIAQGAAADFKTLQGVVGRTKAVKIGATTDPKTAGDIAHTTAALSRLGVTKHAKLVIDGAKSPEQALKGLQKLDAHTLHTKALKIETAAAVAAVGRGLNKVNSKKLIAKALRILTNTQDPQRAFAFLNRQKLPDKEQKFKPGSPQAVLNTYTELATKPPIVVEVQFHGSKTGNWSGASGKFAGGIQAYASGGIDALMNNAFARADRQAGLDPREGARVTNPRYVVGEEPGRTEYIITDNPSYRRSNLSYLAEAARALGVGLIPGFKGGKGNHKKGGGGPGGSNGLGGNLDDLTGSDSDYQRAERKVSYDAGLADLAKNRLSALTPGVTAATVQAAIQQEITDYGALAGLIDSLLPGTPKQMHADVPNVPHVPSKLKGKAKHRATAAAAVAQAAHDAAQAKNDSIKSNYDTLVDEARTIRDITVPGLQLDYNQVGTDAATAIGAQNSSFNTAGLDIFRNFSSNISTISGTSFGGALPSASPSGVAYSPFTTMQSASGQGTASSQTTPATGVGAAGGNTYINNFASPPPDPFTWTQQQAFEVQAV